MHFTVQSLKILAFALLIVFVGQISALPVVPGILDHNLIRWYDSPLPVEVLDISTFGSKNKHFL